jgi:hypothetical protein
MKLRVGPKGWLERELTTVKTQHSEKTGTYLPSGIKQWTTKRVCVTIWRESENVDVLTSVISRPLHQNVEEEEESIKLQRPFLNGMDRSSNGDGEVHKNTVTWWRHMLCNRKYTTKQAYFWWISLLSSGYVGLFPWGVKRPGRESDHSPPTSAEVKKMWICTSTPPYAFMVYCLIS